MQEGRSRGHDMAPEQPYVETTSIGGKVYKVEEIRAYVEQFPEQEIPLAKVKDAVGEGHVYWVDREGNKLAPFQIIQDWDAAQKVETWADHVESIRRADLTKPIWVTADGTVFDGIHRLTRAVLDKQPTIRVRVVTNLPNQS